MNFHLLAVLQIIGIYCIGAVCFLRLFPKRKIHITEVLAYAFGIGTAIEMVTLTLGVLLQQFYIAYFITYLLIGIALYFGWKNRQLFRNVLITFQEKVLLICTAVFIVIQSTIAFAFPLLGNDARAMWLIKGKAIAHGAAAFLEYLRAPMTTFGHQDYPLGLSSIYATFYTIVPKYAEPYIAIFATMFFVSLVLLIGAALIRRFEKISTPLYLIVIGLVFFTSMYTVQGWSGYADVPLSLFFALVVYSFLSFNRENAESWILLIFLCAAGGALTKNEGQTWAIGSILLSSPLLLHHTNRKAYAKIGIALGAVLLPIIGWEYLKLHYHVVNDITTSSQSGRGLLFYAGRIPVLVEQTLNRLLSGYLFGILFGPALITWIITIVQNLKQKSLEAWLPSMLLMGQIGVYTAVYILTPYDLAWHISTSFTRLILHLLPSMYLIVVLQFPYKHDQLS